MPNSPAVPADRWPATKVEMWPVEDLIPYARNARTHPEEQIVQIAASMQRFGFTIPMLVAENGTIIAGHGRLIAAQRIGIPEVPVKGQLVLSRGDYHWQHEPCWYAVREGATGHWAGDRKQTTVWQIPKPSRSETGHGTQKPVDCMKRPIENNSKPGDAVYEPFSGSGTTIIAAEMTGRRCHAVELNPVYVDVAVRRWQEFTGRDAVLESSGATFFATAVALSEADES